MQGNSAPSLSSYNSYSRESSSDSMQRARFHTSSSEGNYNTASTKQRPDQHSIRKSSRHGRHSVTGSRSSMSGRHQGQFDCCVAVEFFAIWLAFFMLLSIRPIVTQVYLLTNIMIRILLSKICNLEVRHYQLPEDLYMHAHIANQWQYGFWACRLWGRSVYSCAYSTAVYQLQDAAMECGVHRVQAKPLLHWGVHSHAVNVHELITHLICSSNFWIFLKSSMARSFLPRYSQSSSVKLAMRSLVNLTSHSTFLRRRYVRKAMR